MIECANDAAAKGLRVQARVAALQLVGTRRDVTELGIVGVPAQRLADAAGDGLMMGDPEDRHLQSGPEGKPARRGITAWRFPFESGAYRPRPLSLSRFCSLASPIPARPNSHVNELTCIG
jgi:hypothetical protein